VTTLAFLAFAPGAGGAEPLSRAPDHAVPVAAGAVPPVLGQEAQSERQYQQAAEAIFVVQGQYHANLDRLKARQQRGSARRTGRTNAISRAPHFAVSSTGYVVATNFRGSRRIGVSNCPWITISIAVQNCSPKSTPIDARARYQSRRIQYQVERAAQSRPEGAEVRRDTKLMLQIGGLLGLAYGAFVALWLWATRVRPRARRGARI
jgi:hypothetical protein